MKKWTHGSLIGLLDVKYSSPEYAFISSVPSRTGAGDYRHADGLAMSLWPSRGLDIIGFEVKVSRGDWIKELKNPVKAETIARYCDYWYMVLASSDILNFGELPSKWGLMIPKGRGLSISKEAERLKPDPLDKTFLASILRCATEQLTEGAKDRKQYQEGYKQGQTDAKDEKNWQIKHLEGDNQQLHKKILDFKNQSGVDINDWRNWKRGNIGEIVKIVLEGEDQEIKQRLQNLRKQAQNILESIDVVLNEQLGDDGF
ncbi:hypothetical protein MUP59_09425 [Candidatus Bathyarchaeota archaeon]|nr:hypothetical protein [Candidatus Bathyarchaeota archaeon]